MTKNKPTYDEAIAELDKILAELENNSDINMDEIAQKVKRASELLQICKKQLHVLDENLEKLLSELEE
ncbi:MAG TPA: exodeoxyribonuclease VII small subunit [Paludibacteraceae bacterium]|jgi:exodeoxyribonuclease VII small subunit|nr:exodeoxyribonuclease VII small subunit [Paludibacteraceae bacterium]OPZ03372.1 MAG: Exonuclease VII small subunit [Bacteroidetes bacterium ADurb.BinA395]MBP8965912.1 exodeoxyribonuclease VII small subunit [Paludibacteraceae bacterium]HOF97813.1 exodeoxyribonuclease VII small subunit [Paludibacteraceae bacterium]HOJ66322.1 exodeoxyribonuclease VII small subunit [Paludibacteraceae bacterium]